MDVKCLQIGFLLFPSIAQLDLTGPAEVFAASQRCDIHLIWKKREPVPTTSGFSIVPTHDFKTVPSLDVICIPGGAEQVALMDDREVLDFIRKQAEQVSFVISVCTGALVLGAAGLLKEGYRATTYWMALSQLELFGAIPVHERVARDRNRITCTGVSSGIDFALALLDWVLGAETAKTVQLGIEYDLHPPYSFSTLTTSERLNHLKQVKADFLKRRWEATQKAAACLGN